MIPANPTAPRSNSKTGWTQVVVGSRCFQVQTLDVAEAERLVKEHLGERL